MKRVSGSIDEAERKAANRRLVEYYKANPMRRKFKVSVVDSSVDTDTTSQSYIQKRPVQVSYKQLYREAGIEHNGSAYPNLISNPMKNAGHAVIEGPYYNVRPSWWG
eukprot:TRINITY_DN9481_c0_g1_i12.p7 TRINITY_DN9481_c0_g1~~TRINITY_DN9481_c0_g1_i12.p7  ORF type:complete len:107 (-),score=33.03 TRINITY_DN9481_c0_g1_i12:68-388(-)